MPVTFVTAFYVLPNYVLTSVDVYLERLELLIQTGIPLLCYLDKALEEKGKTLCEKYINFKIAQYVTLDTSWMPENVHMPFKTREDKDTKEYFAVQLQKAWCLADAAKIARTSHLAWIDAGIFHIIKNKENTVKALQTIASSNWPSEILAPGAWTDADMELDQRLNDWTHFLDIIRWRFLGGFLLGPREVWQDFYEKQTALVTETLPRLGWEVNYWWKLNMFTWYQADHNDDMITNILHYKLSDNQVTFITALYVIPNQKWRNPEFYLEKIEYLIQSGVPIICYLDKALESQGEELKRKYPNLTIPEYVTLDKSWVPTDVSLPSTRFEEKDTIDYLCIQLSKLKLLAKSANIARTTHTAWIDAGILYLIDRDKSRRLLNEIATTSWPNKLFAPGGYDKTWLQEVIKMNADPPRYLHFLEYVIWNYLGGFLLGDKTLWANAFEQQTAVVKKYLPKLSWEVNYWSQMDVFTWYYADHNISMIENLLQFRQV